MEQHQNTKDFATKSGDCGNRIHDLLQVSSNHKCEAVALPTELNPLLLVK